MSPKNYDFPAPNVSEKYKIMDIFVDGFQKLRVYAVETLRSSQYLLSSFWLLGG